MALFKSCAPPPSRPHSTHTRVTRPPQYIPPHPPTHASPPAAPHCLTPHHTTLPTLASPPSVKPARPQPWARPPLAAIQLHITHPLLMHTNHPHTSPHAARFQSRGCRLDWCPEPLTCITAWPDPGRREVPATARSKQAPSGGAASPSSNTQVCGIHARFARARQARRISC